MKVHTQWDELTDIYESMIVWSKRLDNEGPFFRKLFDRIGAQRVIDVACGTGHHAVLFQSWGMTVEAADVSEKMIELAKTRRSDSCGIRWVVRGLEELIRSEKLFDVAVCIGNSLSLVADVASAGRAIQQLLAAVRPGGAVAVHLLNLWRLPDGPCVWQKFTRVPLSSGEVLIAKGVHRNADRGFVNIVIMPIDSAQKAHAKSIPFVGLEAPELETMARHAGAKSVEFFGGYQQQPYNRDESTDLIMVAWK